MRADRLLSLLMLLQARGRMTAAELAEELEVSERTVYRDVEALCTSGVPVLSERGPGGGCELPPRYRTDLTGLTEPEVRGLFTSISAGQLSGLGLDKALEAAMLKLQAALPAVQRQGVERVRGRIHVDSAAWFHSGEPVPHLTTLQEAVWEGRSVVIKYAAATGSRSRQYVNPYGLVAKAGIWYLVGVAVRNRRAYGAAPAKEARQDHSVYRVSRIKEIELTSDLFERDAEFHLASYWASWCSEFEARLPRYGATVRVAPDVLGALPLIYGEGVRSLIESAPPADAEGWTTLTLTFESFDAARGSILGLGTGAEVLEPEDLRNSVMRAAASIVAFYTGGVTARAVIEHAQAARKGNPAVEQNA